MTGGGAGIGFAIARAFARSGARVAIAGRTKERLAHAAASIGDAFGAPVLIVPADVGKHSDCERIVAATVERFDALDILVNNAGLFALVPLLEADHTEAARFINTNVMGPLQCGARVRALGGQAQARGAIVNVSSIAGARPAPGCGLYSASKAALESLTRSMAVEWAPLGMRVNAVAPAMSTPRGCWKTSAPGGSTKRR